MGRKKGSIQKRNEDKYKLPIGVILKPNQNDRFTKESKLIFIDSKYGEFISTFRAIIEAGASTHPLAVSERRRITNLEKYGVENPGANKEVIQKRTETMIQKYGVKNALENPIFVQKSKETIFKNHGVSHPMEKEEFRLKIKKTVKEKYGVDNVMQNQLIQEKLKKQNLEKYGYENASESPIIREKIIKQRLENNYRSKEEQEVVDFIESLGFKTKKSYLGGANPKEIDIKILNTNIAIEYNGILFHSEWSNTIYPNYHNDKRKLAEKNNLKLIQIFDEEWKKRNKQIKSFLKSTLGKNTIKIFARKTELVELDKNEANEFLEKYHILGKTNFIKAFGLKFNNELVSIATVNKHHRNNNEYILNRYCGKENTTVVGGLTKLCKYIKNIYGEFFTWVDLRFSNGENWIKCGWTKVHENPPDYFYFDKNSHKIVSKQSRKKNLINTPKNMTEHEHALKDGLYRVYDCGKLKLKF